MVAAAALGGTLSLSVGRVANAQAISLQKISSAPVGSPQGVGAHISATTQSAGSTMAFQAASSSVAEQGTNISGAIIQKKIEEYTDRDR